VRKIAAGACKVRGKQEHQLHFMRAHVLLQRVWLSRAGEPDLACSENRPASRRDPQKRIKPVTNRILSSPIERQGGLAP
jgi:hypothetical protein